MKFVVSRAVRFALALALVAPAMACSASAPAPGEDVATTRQAANFCVSPQESVDRGDDAAAVEDGGEFEDDIEETGGCGVSGALRPAVTMSVFNTYTINVGIDTGLASPNEIRFYKPDNTAELGRRNIAVLQVVGNAWTMVPVIEPVGAGGNNFTELVNTTGVDITTVPGLTIVAYNGAARTAAAISPAPRIVVARDFNRARTRHNILITVTPPT
jgi:hypothetical protein